MSKASFPADGKARVRVCIVSEWYPTAEHPVLGTFVREQAMAVSRHCDVAVVHWAPRPSAAVPAVVIDDRMDGRVRTLSVGGVARRVETVPKTRGLEHALRRLSRSGFRPHVLHAHVFSAGFPAVLVAARRRLPVVVSEHYSGFALGKLDFRDRLIARLTFRRAAVACPVSRNLQGHLERLGVRANFRVMPNVVDTSIFRPGPTRAAAPGDPRLLAVGMLKPVKEMDSLLDAFAELHRELPDAALGIVGDGPVRGPLERQAEELGIAASVHFHGTLNKPRIADLMRASDLLVLPSRWENLPNVVIEALACGLPVVATRVGGVPELVDLRSGVLVPPGDSSALKEGIHEALTRRAAFDREGIARRAANIFGSEAIGLRWEELYRQVALRGERGSVGRTVRLPRCG